LKDVETETRLDSANVVEIKTLSRVSLITATDMTSEGLWDMFEGDFADTARL
jgi:hypothetical protein